MLVTLLHESVVALQVKQMLVGRLRRRGKKLKEFMLTIKTADSTEINTLLSIYIEKVKWLRSMNKPLWDESQFNLEALNKKYENPVSYVGIINNEIIGGFILVEYDRLYWPEVTDNSTYFFHKFVISNKYCGKNYSDRIIKWVKEYGREMNKKYIRLDYDGNRKPITEMYTRNGFIPVDTISNQHVSKLIKAEYLITGNN